MNSSINYSQYNFSDIGIAQQTMIAQQVTPLTNCTNITNIINIYCEYWNLIIDDYDMVIVSIIIIEVMIILMIKDLYRKYKQGDNK